MENYIPIALLMILAFLVCIAIFVITSLLGPKNPLASKLSTYECGVQPEGTARHPFHSQFYLIAVFFLLFDVEAAFFLPWALVYKNSLATGPELLIAMLLYLSFVVLGLIYVFRKKCLELL